MGCSPNHVEEREDAVKRVPYYYDAFISVEFCSANPLWKMTLHDPNFIVNHAFAFQAHVTKLPIQRSLDVTIRAC